MKCYRKNGSDVTAGGRRGLGLLPSMKCYRKNGSDPRQGRTRTGPTGPSLNEVLPKER